jgi:LacI family transcriptional regulator
LIFAKEDCPFMTPTLADVANHAGVSTMTASRALNGRSGVSQSTRDRVVASSKALGYVANISARGLVGGRMNILGMVVPDLATQYTGEVVAGAGEAANELGFDLLLYTTSSDVGRERERAVLLTNGLADGILAVLPQDPENVLGALSKSGIPVVIVDHRGAITNLPAIAVDNYTGARLAVEHLVALGHRRIGFLEGVGDVDCSRERLRGYREGLLNAGIEFDQGLVRPGEFKQPNGFQATTALLEQAAPPTAIFAANDLSAFGAIEAIKERGLRVPDDVSVVGFDDIPMASQIFPTLTTVRQPLHQMGASAVNLLVSMVVGLNPVTQRIHLPTELIVRASTGPVRKESR